MSDTFQLDGPRQDPAKGGEADALVVLLHGLGADGNDLFGLVPHLAQVLPGAAFVSPHAPFPCDMAPFGRQWFSLQDRTADAMLGGCAWPRRFSMLSSMRNWRAMAWPRTVSPWSASPKAP